MKKEKELNKFLMDLFTGKIGFINPVKETPITGERLGKFIADKFGYVDPPNNANGAGVVLRTVLDSFQENFPVVIGNVRRSTKQVVHTNGKIERILLDYDEAPYGYYYCTRPEEFDEVIRSRTKKIMGQVKRIQHTIGVRNNVYGLGGVPIDTKDKDSEGQDHRDFIKGITNAKHTPNNHSAKIDEILDFLK